MEKASARLAAAQNRERASPAVVQARTALVTMAVTVLQTVLLGWFGFALTGRLELALKERSMTLESAKALATLVSEMQDSGQTAETQKASVRKIAMFGSEAIEPLSIMAAATGPYKEQIPLDGLRLVAVQHRKEICKALGNAVGAKALIDTVRFESIEKLHKELKC
jgi:hypothetical protein